MSEDDDGGESAGAEALIQMRPTTRRSTIWAITAVMVVLASSFAHGEERSLVGATDWPGWRGPERDGTALGFAVPEVWPEELQRRWRVRVGSGYSAPVVAGSRVFVQSREEGHEVVRALELASGKVLWNQRYAVPFNPRMGSGRHGPGPKASPAHDGERLFTTSITGVLSAWAADSGELLWREDFADRFKKTLPHFGAAASPLVNGSRVVSNFGGKDGAVIAFDVETGDEVWASSSDGASYASAIVTAFGGSQQVVTISAKAVVSFDVQTGQPGWRYTFPQSMMHHNIVTPLSVGDLVVISGKGRGITALRASSGGDGWSVEPAWQIDSLAMDMSSPVQSDGRIYGLSHQDKGRIFSLDAATGEILWTGPGRTAKYASLLVVDGAILALTGSAELIVLSDNGNSYDELARYTVAESPTWTHLVPIDGGVLVKDQDHLSFWSWFAGQ